MPSVLPPIRCVNCGVEYPRSLLWLGAKRPVCRACKEKLAESWAAWGATP